MAKLEEREGVRMEKRVEMNRLLDFYGALLTEHRRDVMRAYLEEDLSLQEIADNMSITRQGVHDAINKAQKQLTEYENKLGLLSRYQKLQKAVVLGKEALQEGTPESIQRAAEILNSIIDIER